MGKYCDLFYTNFPYCDVWIVLVTTVGTEVTAVWMLVGNFDSEAFVCSVWMVVKSVQTSCNLGLCF